MGKEVKIGCWSGFWGDWHASASQLLTDSSVQYLIGDYLAELTMSILAKQKMAKPDEAGYATHFATVVMPQIAKQVAERKVKVITNAGGLNPMALRAALEKVFTKLGVDLKVGVVLGDDLSDQLDDLAENAKEIDTGRKFPHKAKVLSVNAYLGAAPIVQALRDGADIVVTGRVVDSALALAPLMYEFGWTPADYHLLSSGTLVGHLLECGAQCTGGLFTDCLQSVKSWNNIGYPIASVSQDGSFTITKPANTDGLVTAASVTEQLFYEVGNPGAYLVPEVSCDWRFVKISQQAKDLVHVVGARGRPPPTSLKVSATYFDGYKATIALVIIGFNAREKAKRTADTILFRARAGLRKKKVKDFSRVGIELLGSESNFGQNANPGALNTRECVLKLTCTHKDKKALGAFLREAPPAGTSFAPGTTALGGGPGNAVIPVVRLFSTTRTREQTGPMKVLVGSTETVVPWPNSPGNFGPPEEITGLEVTAPSGDLRRARLIEFCHGRSGDKGDSCNIALYSRDPSYLPVLRHIVTAEVVKHHFRHVCDGNVTRWDAPGPNAMNFLLEKTLDGGGMASLRCDSLGKGYAQQLLGMEVNVPANWVTPSHIPILPLSNQVRPGLPLEAFHEGGVKFQVDTPGVAVITFTRGRERNTINSGMVMGLKKACAMLRPASPRIRAVFLKAEGRHFCTGGDPIEFLGKADKSGAEVHFAELLKELATLPQCLIGIIQGNVFGGGMGFVSVCDVGIAMSSARFALSEVKLGMVPATISPYVIRKIGYSHAKKMFVMGTLVSAEEAKSAGLVHYVCADKLQVQNVANNILKSLKVAEFKKWFSRRFYSNRIIFYFKRIV